MALSPLLKPVIGPRPKKQPEPDERSLLRSTVDTGLGLLGLLDLPGSSVRDVLAGENPFDQWIHPMDQSRRATGREVLHTWGLASENDPEKWEAADFSGFGAEVLLDPLTYLTFGGSALTKAGQIASRASALKPVLRATGQGKRVGGMRTTLNDAVRYFRNLGEEGATYLDRMDEAARGLGYRSLDDAAAQVGEESLSGLVGVGLPFAAPKVVLGRGAKAQRVARVMDKAGEAVARTPPVRMAKMLFSRRAGNQYSEAGQKLAAKLIDEKDAAKAVASRMDRNMQKAYQAGLAAFRRTFGEAAPADLRVDPADIHLRALELSKLENVLQQENLPEFYKWKSENLRIVNKLRRLANEGRDYASLPGYDELFEQLRKYVLHYDASDDEIVRLIVSNKKPKRSWDQLLRDAANEIAEDVRTGRRLAPGGHAVVEYTTKTLDGTAVKHQGLVIEPGTRRSKVLLHNARDGSIYSVLVSNNRLKAVDAPEEVASAWKEIALRKRYSDLLYRAGELGDAKRALREAGLDGSFAPELDKVVKALKGFKDPLHESIYEMGGKTGRHTVEEGFKTEHMPRTGVAGSVENAAARQGLQTVSASMRARDPVWRDIPTVLANELASDPRYRGEGAAELIRREYDQWLNPDFGKESSDQLEFPFGALANQANDIDGKMLHAEALADRIKERPLGDIFRRELKREMTDYIRSNANVQAGLRALHAVALESARYGGTGIGLHRFYELAGLDPDRAFEYFAKLKGISPSRAGAYTVSEELAAVATQFENIMNPKKWEGVLQRFIDRMNKWFKDNVTIGWPAFWSRNHGSGQFVNLTSGYISAKELPLYMRFYRESAKLAERVQQELASGSLTPETEQILADLIDLGVVSRNIHWMDIDMSQFAGSSTAMLPEADWLEGAIPRQQPWNVAETWRRVGREMEEEISAAAEAGLSAPVMSRGPVRRTLQQTHRTWLASGAAMNQWVEWLNRVPLFLTLRRKGYSPEAAAEVVKRLHFDYSDLSHFEKEVMRRLFPFYTFTRKMGELVWLTLAQRPGGALAQTIRARQRMRSDDPAMPDYVSQTMAVPVEGPLATLLGSPPEGTQRYVTGFGLAHEDPLSFFGGGVRGALAEAGSRLTPLAKAAIEWMTGETLFQRGPSGGRELSDLDPTIGRTISNVGEMLGNEPWEDASGRAYPFPNQGVEFLLGNSPAARLLTTARMLTDRRKGLRARLANLLTGLRISDISPAAQDAVLRERLQAAMLDEGARQFRSVYFKGGPKTEREERMNALLRLLDRRAKERSRQKANEKQPARTR